MTSYSVSARSSFHAADVGASRDGSGVVEFSSKDDMEYALRKFDDSKFRSHEGDETRIQLKPEDDSRGGGRSRSRGRSPPPYERRRSFSPRHERRSNDRRSPRDDRYRSRSR